MDKAILAGSGIYAITNTANGKQYIGSAVHIAARWRLHRHKLRINEHHSPRMQNAWNKYGEEAFDFSVLEVVADKTDLLKREQYWLDAKEATGPRGYNVLATAGSRLGHKVSDAVREAMSKRMSTPEAKARGRLFMLGRKSSPETIEKMRNSKRGQLNDIEAMRKCWDANKGRKHTEEARKKMSLAMKGRVPSEETRAKWSAIRTGKTQSDESKNKKREALLGRPRDPEVIARIVATKLRKKLERLAQAI